MTQLDQYPLSDMKLESGKEELDKCSIVIFSIFGVCLNIGV